MDPHRPGYLKDVLPPKEAPPDTHAIAPADVLWQRVALLRALWRTLDLIELSPTERPGVGDPATSDEKDLNGGYARFALRFAPQLRKLGHDPTLVPESYKMDVALSQLGGGNGEVMNVARAGTFVLVGAMTGNSQKVETVGAQIQADPARDDGERRHVKVALEPIAAVRLGDLKSAALRQGRTTDKLTQQQAELLAAQGQQQVILGRNHLKATPLPEVSPLPGKKRSKGKAGGGSTKKAGTKAGHQTGTSAGHKTGTSTGHQTGTSTGHKTGTSTGHKTGTSTGHKTGGKAPATPGKPPETLH